MTRRGHNSLLVEEAPNARRQAFIAKRGCTHEHVTTACVGACVLVEWDYAELERRLSNHPATRRAVETLFAKKLLAKVEHMNEELVHRASASEASKVKTV